MNQLAPGPVTLMDVANEAGVSLATASRAFNGSKRKVGEELRQRVLAAAVKLNYSANAPAQAMAKGRTNVVGLVVHDIADPYFSSIAAGVVRAADEHHLLVSLGTTVHRPERELEYLASLRGQRSRAAILVGSRTADARLTARLSREIVAFQGSGGHVVAVSQAKFPVDTIAIENRKGARALAAELVELGYRRFAVLAGPTELLTAKDRVNGFRDALTKAGLPAPVLLRGAFTRDGGHDAMAHLLDSHHQVDCVFAVNDVMAVGAMAACRTRGVRPGIDIGLAGFDDIGTLRDIHPSLTTVRLPLEQIGELALELVLTADHQPPRRRRVSGEVVIRDSTPRRV
ncbi:MAG: LacI family DNA-binding transcriptional regulator [Nocardioides sp.]|uniref:LacI family DNA-binding transcriptional regulator n=1 Tax=Nocardioides sp. TaxID=35761 RepID=UPI0039E4A82C